MRLRSENTRAAALFGAAIVLGVATGSATAEPVKIRLGTGSAVEEQLWLILVKPDIAPNYGKAYTLEPNKFRSSSKRVQAFEAGALDVITTSANGAIFAASGGVDHKFVASLSRESRDGFYTKFMVKVNSPIKSVKDLKGKVIGINGFNGSGHLWTKIVLEKNGLTEKDVTLTPVPFPAQGQALKAGTVAVGMFPQPFADIVEKDPGARTVYTSKDAAPFSEELMVLIAKPAYVKANRKAIEALVSDLRASTKYYGENTTKARQALIDGKMVRTPAAIYLKMKDYYRDPSVKVDLAALEKMQELQMAAGFQKKKVDLKCRVDWDCAGK